MNDSRFDNITVGRHLIVILRLLGHLRRDPSPTGGSSLVEAMRRYHRYVLHLPLTITFIMLIWVEAITSRNLEQAGEVIYMSFIVSAMGVKILNLWWLDETARHFIAELATSGEYTLRSEEERRLWHREQRSFGRTAAIYMGGSILACVYSFVVVLVRLTYKLPFPYWVPFDIAQHGNFWVAYGYSFFAMILCCLSNITLDMSYCYFMFHVALLYKLIAWRLEALRTLAPANVVVELKNIFRLHEKVKRLTEECQSLVSVPIVAQIILSVYILCFCGYRIKNTRISENPDQFAFMMQIISLMTTQIFLPCYYGNAITVNANALTNSVYRTDWPQWPVPMRKLIFVYMEFLKRPVQIKAGYFFAVGLPMFTKTINNAYSLFAVLLSMDN